MLLLLQLLLHMYGVLYACVSVAIFAASVAIIMQTVLHDFLVAHVTAGDAQPGESIIKLSAENHAQMEKVTVACVEEGRNFRILHSLLAQAPRKAPARSMLIVALRSADQVVDYKLSGSRDASIAFCKAEAEKLHMLWSYVWWCFQRSPKGSKHDAMRQLKAVLREADCLKQRVPPAKSRIPAILDAMAQSTIEVSDSDEDIVSEDDWLYPRRQPGSDDENEDVDLRYPLTSNIWSH